MSNNLDDTIVLNSGTYSVVENNTSLLLIKQTPIPFILNIKDTPQDLLVKNTKDNSLCLLRVLKNNFNIYYDNYPRGSDTYFLNSYRFPNVFVNNLSENYTSVFEKSEQNLRQVFKEQNGSEQDFYNFKFLTGSNTYEGTLHYKYNDISLYSVPYNFTINNTVGLSLANSSATRDYYVISTIEDISSITEETQYTDATIYHRLIYSDFTSVYLPNTIKDVTLKVKDGFFNSYMLTGDINTLNVYDIDSYLNYSILYYNSFNVLKANFYISDLDLTLIQDSYFTVSTFDLKDTLSIKLMSYSMYRTLNFSFPIFNLNYLPEISLFDNSSYYSSGSPVRLFSFSSKELYYEAMELYPTLYNLFTIDGVSVLDDILYYKNYRHNFSKSSCQVMYLYNVTTNLTSESLIKANKIISENTILPAFQDAPVLEATNSSLKLSNRSSTNSITSIDSFVMISNNSCTITLPQGKLDPNYKIYNLYYNTTKAKLVDKEGNNLFDNSLTDLKGVDITRVLPFSIVARQIPSSVNDYTYNNLSYEDAKQAGLIYTTNSSIIATNELLIVKQKNTEGLAFALNVLYPLPLIETTLSFPSYISSTASAGVIIHNSPSLLSFDYIVFNGKVYLRNEFKDLVLKSGDVVYGCSNYSYSNFYFHKITIQNKKTEIFLEKQSSSGSTSFINIKANYPCSNVYAYFSDNVSDKKDITNFLYNKLYFNSKDYSNGVYGYNPPIIEENLTYLFSTDLVGTLFVATKDLDNNDVITSIQISRG